MAKLFVSYSRRDSVAARRLIEAFRSIDQDVWVDWESIPPAVDWLEQIFRGIEESDAFIFLLSPDSIASEVCKVEINRAAQNNKRIIPIVLRDVHPKDTPESISKLNWTFMRETDDFAEGLAKVKTAIELDLDWLEEHRRLQVRALEWERKKDVSLLLHGRDLRNARRMVDTATSKDPPATDLQKTYIQHSLRSDRNRTAAWLATGLALVVMAVLALIAMNRSEVARENEQKARLQEARAEENAVLAVRNQHRAETSAIVAKINAARADQERIAAEDAENLAQSQRSAARAQIHLNRPGELYTSTLLAIDSMRREPSDEAEEILRRNINLLPLPVAQFAPQKQRISALVLHPEDNSFATASADGTVCAWRIEEEEADNLFCTTSHGSGINAVAFSRDGSVLLTGDQAGLVQIIDSQTGEVRRSFRRVEPEGSTVQIAEVEPPLLQDAVAPPEIPIRSISARHTLAQQIAVAYSDGWIAVFDAITGKISSPIYVTNHPNVSGISPNGAWLVAGSEAGRVSVWNLSSRNRFSTSTHRGGVLAMAFSPRENKVATAGGDTIAMTNLSTEKELYRILVQSPVRDLAFSPDGHWFVSVSDDHRIRVWDTLTGTELLAMSQDGIVSEVVVSSNGRWIATTGNDRTARVWDAGTGAEIFQIPLKASGSRLMFSNDDRWLISTDDSGAVAIWDISVMILPELSVLSDTIVSHVQYSPSGERLAVSSADKVWLLTPEGEDILRESALGEPIADFNSTVKKLAFSADSDLLGVLTEENELAIYSVAERNLQSVRVSERIQSIAFAPDSQQLITSNVNGNVQAWNVIDGNLLSDGEEFPEGSALSSAGEVLAVGSPDQIMLLGEDVNGALPTIQTSADIALLVLSPDGSQLASGSSSGEVTIFRNESGRLRRFTSFGKGQATSLAFSPDGSLIAVGTARTVYLMDTTTGKEVARIPHLSTVNGVSFSPDGNYLATASSRSLQFWELASIPQVKSEALIAAACTYLYEEFTPAQWQTFFGNERQESLCNNLAP